MKKPALRLPGDEFLHEEAATLANEREAVLRTKYTREHVHAQALMTELGALRERLTLLERIDAIVPRPPQWTTAVRGKGKLHHAIPTLLLSDCHWDEVVRPEEVEGVNAYNREIAVKRLQRVLHNTIDVARNYFAGLHYDGCVLMLGGDCLSGNIHEELEQTNEDTVYGSLDYWSDHLTGFIQALAAEFGHLHCVGVVGNHGRHTRKPRAKLRVRDNLDWLLYRVVAKAVKGNITWQIPESADADVPIYSTRYRLTHGDQFRGGSGIAGMLSPLMIGHHRKSRRQMALRKPFDWLCFPAETTVVCESGIKPISAVQVGDRVLTHQHRWRSVTAVMSREASSIVSLTGHGHPRFVVSSEHPIRASMIPRKPCGRTGERLAIMSVQTEWLPADAIVGKYWHSPAIAEPLSFPTPNDHLCECGPQAQPIDVSPALFRFVGRYLAEGSLERNHRCGGGISLACHAREAPAVAAEVAAIGRSPSITYRGEHGASVSCTAVTLARWLEAHFGRGATNKTLPGWALGMRREFREALLTGYLLGDGHRPEPTRWEAKTVSRGLAIGIKILAQTLHHRTSLYWQPSAAGGFAGPLGQPQWVIKGTEVDRRHPATKWHDDDLLGRIKRCVSVPGQYRVFNLSVEEDESYIADGIVVHNCMGHWHDYWMGKGIIVNSSLKGYDEYAYLNNFEPQRALQAFFITTPEHGATFPAPIFADDRKSEGW